MKPIKRRLRDDAGPVEEPLHGPERASFHTGRGSPGDAGSRPAREAPESKSLFHAVLNAAPQAVLIVDAKQKIAWVNLAACDLFGYRPHELIEHDLERLIPEGLTKARSTHGPDDRAHSRRRPTAARSRLTGRRKDGRPISLEAAVAYVQTSEGRLSAAFVSSTGTSARSQPEGRVAEDRRLLRRLTSRLVSQTEKETSRWARELHDVYSQRLVSIALELGKARHRNLGPRVLETIEAQIRSLAEDVHRMSRRMHPSVLHDLGLAAALQSELTAFERENEIQTELHAANIPPELPPEVALCLYRVAQEALTNVRKHSRSKRVQVEVDGAGGALTMTIADEGDGFEPRRNRRGGLGLLSMEERVLAVKGEFRVESSRGKGAVVHVRIPIAK